MEKFASYYKILRSGTNCWGKNCNRNSKDDCEGYGIKREDLGTILKKLKNGKSSGENIYTFWNVQILIRKI